MPLRSVTVTPEVVVRNGVLIILPFASFSPLLQSGEMISPDTLSSQGFDPFDFSKRKR
jgi:hypothetical protein